MSRLDSFINRMSAQRDLLNHIRDAYPLPEGPVLEIGLGNGRTFSHLRENFTGRRIIAFDRQLGAHKSSIPQDGDLILGKSTRPAKTSSAAVRLSSMPISAPAILNVTQSHSTGCRIWWRGCCGPAAMRSVACRSTTKHSSRYQSSIISRKIAISSIAACPDFCIEVGNARHLPQIRLKYRRFDDYKILFCRPLIDKRELTQANSVKFGCHCPKSLCKCTAELHAHTRAIGHDLAKTVLGDTKRFDLGCGAGGHPSRTMAKKRHFTDDGFTVNLAYSDFTCGWA